MSEWKETYKGYNWIKTGGFRGKNPSSFRKRMVADSERLYFTLGYKAPVSIFNAADGELIAVCKGSDDPKKLILCSGILCVQLSNAIAAYNSLDGSELWKKESSGINEFAAHGKSLVYHTGKNQLHCIDIKTGNSLWDSKLERAGQLKISDNKVLSVIGTDMQVFALDTGRSIWCNKKEKPSKSIKRKGYYIIDDTIWTGYKGDRIDLNTGEKMPSLEVENLWSPQHHHRCYPNKATSRYIIGAMEGWNFLP